MFKKIIAYFKSLFSWKKDYEMLLAHEIEYVEPKVRLEDHEIEYFVGTPLIMEDHEIEIELPVKKAKRTTKKEA